jgi:hypothetical protein
MRSCRQQRDPNGVNFRQDDALHQQGGSVEALIERGVMPSDPRIGGTRSNCRSQLAQQSPSIPVYAVSGLALGARVQFDSSAYREYKCGPSDQFDGFTWCQKTRKDKERRGTFNATYSILHSRDGTAVYVNRYQEPAFFGATEAADDIQRYSRKIGESPRITRLPHRAGLPNGILASWGKVELEPLDNDNIKALAEGRRPTTKGYFIDFIGNFARSANEGLPIYRLSGGAGFVWLAFYDQKGRGILRFLAVDASPKDVSEIYQEIAFRNFRQCFFLSDAGCNRTYGILSGVMPTLNPALSELIAQPDPIREFKYEGRCFFSVALDVKKSLLQKSFDGSYLEDQTGYVAYFLNFNGNPNSVKIIDAPEYIKIAFEPPRGDPDFLAHFPELTDGLPRSHSGKPAMIISYPL